MPLLRLAGWSAVGGCVWGGVEMLRSGGLPSLLSCNGLARPDDFGKRLVTEYSMLLLNYFRHAARPLPLGR